jgi:hypothetical protein
MVLKAGHVLTYEHTEPFRGSWQCIFEYNQSRCRSLVIFPPMIILVIVVFDMSSLPKQCQA